MKKSICFTLLAFLIACNTAKHPQSQSISNIELQTRLIKSYDSTMIFQDSIKHKIFDVIISIINRSDTSISFWVMSSSWFDNFMINNDYIEFISGPINHNFPIKVSIEPHDSIVGCVSLIRYEQTRYQTINTTRFGFILIDTTMCQKDYDFDSIIGDKSKHDKVIWSNPLYLNKRE